MTIVRVVCPNCHRTLELTASEVIVRIGPEPYNVGARFVCEACLVRGDVPINPRAADALTLGGSAVLQITDEDLEELVPAGDRLTMVDAITFAIALAETDFPQTELLDDGN